MGLLFPFTATHAATHAAGETVSTMLLNPDIDTEWIGVAKRRLAELRSKCINPVPGDQVFARIRESFGR